MDDLLFLFQGELSLEANFYLRDNPDGTVSFESVASPNNFIAVQGGTTLLKNFSIFTVVSNSTNSIAILAKISVLQDASIWTNYQSAYKINVLS